MSVSSFHGFDIRDDVLTALLFGTSLNNWHKKTALAFYFGATVKQWDVASFSAGNVQMRKVWYISNAVVEISAQPPGGKSLGYILKQLQ